MNIDRFLLIHQSYSLEKISELNKKSLVAQYAQNEQMRKIKAEIGISNENTSKILKNQIKELERQEKVRFYKHLAFLLNDFVTRIENETDVYYKHFLTDVFYSPINFSVSDLIQNLEDIQDKEYVKSFGLHINSLHTNIDQECADYKSSKWSRLYELSAKLNESLSSNELKENEREIIKLQAQRSRSTESNGCGKGCLITSSVVLLFIGTMAIVAFVKHDPDAMGGIHAFLFWSLITAGIYAYYRHSQKKDKELSSILHNGKKQIDEKIKVLSERNVELTNQQSLLEKEYKEIKEELSSIHPDFEEILNDFYKCFPETQANIEATESKKAKQNSKKYDTLCKDATYLIVDCCSASVSMIQRNFSIGYNRATRITEQLEDIGIICSQVGTKELKVLVFDKETANKLLESAGIPT